MSNRSINLDRLEWIVHSPGPAIRTLIRTAGHLLLWPIRVYRSRQALHQLSALSARELRDIGLTTYDVQSAHGLPLDVDPTKMLETRARERARSEIDSRYY